MQAKLYQAAKTMGFIGVCIAMVVLLIILVQIFLDIQKLEWKWNGAATADLLEGVIAAIVLIVFVVPEG